MKYINILPVLLLLSTILQATISEQESSKQYALVFKMHSDDQSELYATVPVDSIPSPMVRSGQQPMAAIVINEEAFKPEIDKTHMVVCEQNPVIESHDIDVLGSLLRVYKVTISRPIAQSFAFIVASHVQELNVSLVELVNQRKIVVDDIDDVLTHLDIDPHYKPQELSSSKGFFLKWGYYLFEKLPLSVQAFILRK